MHNACGQGIPANEQEICQSVEYGKLDWHQKENAGLQSHKCSIRVPAAMTAASANCPLLVAHQKAKQETKPEANCKSIHSLQQNSMLGAVMHMQEACSCLGLHWKHLSSRQGGGLIELVQ